MARPKPGQGQSHGPPVSRLRAAGDAPPSPHGLTGDAASAFSAQLVGVLCGVVGLIIAARVLGPTGRGLLALVTLWISLFALAVPFSMGYGLAFELRRERARLDDALSSAAGLALVLGTAATGLAVVGAWRCSFGILEGVSPGQVMVGAIGLPAMIFTGLSALVLTAAGRLREASLIGAIGSIALLALLAVLLLALQLGVWGAILASSLASITGAILTLLWFRSHFRAALIVRPALWTSALRFGAKLHPGVIAQWANYSLDRFLINVFLGPSAVGVYAVAASLGERLWMLPGAVGSSLLSRTGGNAPDDAHLTARACRSTLWLMAGACLALGLAAPLVIPALFGASFAAAAKPLRILLPGILLLSAGKTVAPYLLNHNRPWAGTWISLVSVSGTVILNLLLIPRFGIVGSALASTAAYAANGVLHCVVFLRLSGIAPAELLLPQATQHCPVPSANTHIQRRLQTVTSVASTEGGR